MHNLVDMTCRVVPYFANLLSYSVATLRYGDQAEWKATIGTGALPHILGESPLGLEAKGKVVGWARQSRCLSGFLKTIIQYYS